MIINGVERLVLVTAGGVVINDALGNPVQLPGGRNPGGRVYGSDIMGGWICLVWCYGEPE